MNKILTISNFITFLRMFSGIPLILFLERMNISNEYFYYSIYVVLFIVISDVLDGYIARKTNTVSSLGKILDPVADKICLMCVLVYLIDIYHIPFLVFFILLSIRDVVLISYTVYLILYRNIVTQANNWGKFFIFITMLMIVFHLYNLNSFIATILYMASISLLIISMVVYVKEHSETIHSN
tara:strand:- start:132 stop:677 length:546 start_codon:yes stop_codon:yes gene_type:complete